MPAKPEAYVAIEAAASPAFSRDGGTLFHLRGSSLPQIWALDLATGQDRALTDHDEKIAFIRRAPGDDRLIYGIDAGGDERQQLWLYDNHTARPLTADPAVIHDFGAWSPDGTHIAYAANDRDEAHFDVMVRPLAGEGAAQRFHEGTNQLAVAGYSPDGRRIAVVLDHAFEQQSLLLLDVIGGARHEIAPATPTRFASVRWATDGDGLLCLTDAGGRDFLALCRLDPHSGAATVLFEAPGRDVEAYAVSPDGAMLATIENDRGYCGAARGAVRRGAGRNRGPAARRRHRPRLVGGFCATRVRRGGPDHARRACSCSRGARHARCGAPIRRRRPASTRRVSAISRWSSGRASMRSKYRAGSRRPAGEPPPGGWPAVVWVHGGPASQTRANFRADMQMLLAHGYAVLMPNVRGSTGYGRAWTLADEQERRLDSVRDLAAGGRMARGAAGDRRRPDRGGRAELRRLHGERRDHRAPRAVARRNQLLRDRRFHDAAGRHRGVAPHPPRARVWRSGRPDGAVRAHLAGAQHRPRDGAAAAAARQAGSARAVRRERADGGGAARAAA